MYEGHGVRLVSFIYHRCDTWKYS